MKLKKFLALPSLAVMSIAGLTGCGKQSDQLTIWTFSSELKEIVKNYYGNNAKVVIKSSVAQVQTDLNNVIKSKKKIPDIVALEAAVIANFTSKESSESILEPLDDIEGTDDMYSYTKSVATSTDGKLLGLSWQATPGGFFYKKSVASKVGINSVEEMEAKISTWEGYLDLAQTCYETKVDNNPIAICSSITDPVKVFLSARENPWVVNNYLQTEEVMFGGGTVTNCFDVVRTLQQSHYTHESSDRGAGWFNDIDRADTLGYFCSSWGLNFDLMPNAKSTVGDWQMCKAPVDYFKGGTWLAIPKGCAHLDEAKDFIKFITTDKEFLKKRGKETGDFMNSKTAMQEIIADYSCAFLGGQNHLAKLYEVAQNINGELISPYDAQIDAEFTNSVADFARDDRPVEDARDIQKSNFVTGVQTKYPSIVYSNK